MKPRNIFLPTKTNKTDKLLLRRIKKKREGTQIKKTRNERGSITTDFAEIQKSIQKFI